MKLIERIGQNLKKARIDKELSQHELSRRSGVSLSIINWIECGKRDNITIKTLERILKILEVPFDNLIK